MRNGTYSMSLMTRMRERTGKWEGEIEIDGDLERESAGGTESERKK